MPNPTTDILLTNDDGIYAPGLLALKQAMSALGNVMVVAPDAERSAFGHAITVADPLRAWDVPWTGPVRGIAVNGTPADCVKLAVNTLLPAPPKLVVSGINLGPNTGTNVLYSGTVSAATEGTILGIPSLAVSLCSYAKDSDFSFAGACALRLAKLILQHGLPTGVLLNLNVPAIPKDRIRGLKLTRLARYRYRDHYEAREDPRGRTYYWLTGLDAEILDPAPDQDAVAVNEGYASVTPLGYDLTCDRVLKDLAGWTDGAGKVF